MKERIRNHGHRKDPLERIANAIERIADAFETSTMTQSKAMAHLLSDLRGIGRRHRILRRDRGEMPQSVIDAEFLPPKQ